jgi:hypothetical protein
MYEQKQGLGEEVLAVTAVGRVCVCKELVKGSILLLAQRFCIAPL